MQLVTPDTPSPPCLSALLLKTLVCLYTWLWNIACLGGTGCLWSLYLFPTLFYPYCRTRMLPLAAAITMGEHQPTGDISQGGSPIDVRGRGLSVGAL